MMTWLKTQLDIVTFMVLAAAFLIWPEIDLWISGLFFNTEQDFIYGDNAVVLSVYELFRHAPKFILPILLIMTGLSFVKGRFGLGTDQRKPWVFLTLARLIGPGILVHLVVKENWDRPRPRSVQEFGGYKDFIPAFIPAAMIADQPGNNKSFVSGHAAMGFYLMVFAWVFRRRSWFYAGLAMGFVVSFGRLVQGGHFASDLIFSGFLCYFSYRLLSYWILGYSRILPDSDPSSNQGGKAT
jgi:lipid A 4'-phosphatase